MKPGPIPVVRRGYIAFNTKGSSGVACMCRNLRGSSCSGTTIWAGEQEKSRKQRFCIIWQHNPDGNLIAFASADVGKTLNPTIFGSVRESPMLPPMEIFDFIKSHELDDLSEDPERAFIQFVRLAQPRLEERLEELGQRDQENYELIDDAKYGFQNVVLGAARKFAIEPFASLAMPTIVQFDDKSYRQFRADLTHYLTQILLIAADRDRSDSVPLPEKSQDSLRQYIHHLRAAIDKSTLTDAKKAVLHKRLDALETELSRKRVRFLVVARVVIEILSVPGALYERYEVVQRLTTNIIREVGEAKAVEDEQKHIPTIEQHVVLAPPRPTKSTSKELFNRDEMDEEIPF